MLKRVIGPMIFGLGGVAILISLGIWQVSRLAWKTDLVARIEAGIHAEPVPLPSAPDPVADRYRPVTAEGRYTGEAVQVLASLQGPGTGTHVIAVLQTPDGRRVLVDRGFLPDASRAGAVIAAEGVEVSGNLLWPDDADSFTPAPDLGRGLWFSRNVAPIAEFLHTEPVLIIARHDNAPIAGLARAPVDSAAIKNDHLGYAVTWFLLALVWSGMTVFLLWRIRRNRA